MKLVMVLVNDRAYRMPLNKAMEMIDMLKKEHKGKNMILALRKDSLIEMRKDVFTNAYDVLKVTQEWLKKGYKVYSIKSFS